MSHQRKSNSNVVTLDAKTQDKVESILKDIFKTDDVEWGSYSRFYVKVSAVRPQMILDANGRLFDSVMSLMYTTDGKYVEVSIDVGEKLSKIIKAVEN